MDNLSEEDKEYRLAVLQANSLKGAAKISKQITYNGITYPSISAAIKAEGMSSSTFYKRIKEQGYEVKK